MENWERGKFEEEWSKAFQDAEGTAPKSAWTSIDLALTQAESGSMRRQVIWYQRLAAAAIVFAILVGLGTFYFNSSDFSKDQSVQLAQSKGSIENQNDQFIQAKSSDSNTAGNQLKSSSPATEKSLPSSARKDYANQSEQPGAYTLATHQSSNTSNEGLMPQSVVDLESIRNRANSFALALNVNEPEAKVQGQPREVTIWRRLPAFPASYMDNAKKDEANKESLWASVGAAAGSYNPNMNRSDAVMSTSVSSASGTFTGTGYSQSSNQGTAYSFGLAMGTALSDRWVLQGGLNYLSQNLSYQSNILAFNASNKGQTAVADFASRNTSGAIYQLTSPYEVSSINEIVSVPLQAGYRIINRKFAWQLNSGIATDLFLRNTLEDKSGQLGRYSESAGSNSPYRTISWAGLLGSEFSYKFADRYRISLVPGLRYSFNSVLKSESGTASNPLIMDVGFRFRYIFK